MSPKKERMKLFTLRIDLLETCIPIWRVVTVPDFYSLRDVYRVFIEAFGWDENYDYSFVIKDDIYYGNPEIGVVRKRHHMEFLPDAYSETIIDGLGDLLGYSKKFQMRLVSNDTWIVQVTVLKKVSVDLDLFNFECLDGEGACPSSFFPGADEFNKVYTLSHDPDVDPEIKQEVDEYIKDNELEVDGKWPGEFSLDEANQRLNNLKETLRNELDEFNCKYSEMIEQIKSEYLDGAINSELEDDESENDVEPETNELYSSLINLLKSYNISSDREDLYNPVYNPAEFNDIIKRIEQNPDPEIQAEARELKKAFDELILYWHLNQLVGEIDSSISTEPEKKTPKNKRKKK